MPELFVRGNIAKPERPHYALIVRYRVMSEKPILSCCITSKDQRRKR